MAQSVPVQPMPELNPDAAVGASVVTCWTTRGYRILKCFYYLISAITDTKRQRALLIYTVGPRVRESFKQIPNTGDNNNFKTPNTFNHKLTAGMKFTGSAKPNKIKQSRRTNSTLAYEHLSKIVNLNMIKSGHRRLARSFNLCYRYIDDLIVFNNKKFLDYLKEIYPS